MLVAPGAVATIADFTNGWLKPASEMHYPREQVYHTMSGTY